MLPVQFFTFRGPLVSDSRFNRLSVLRPIVVIVYTFFTRRSLEWSA